MAGLGVSGFAAADALLRLGARVTAFDTRPDVGDRAQILDVLGADVRLGTDARATLPRDTDLVIASPSWASSQPLLLAATAAGVPVWGEVELAWRLRPAAGAAPWLLLTGATGTATVAAMLTAMLRAAGQNPVAAGNEAMTAVEAVLTVPAYDVMVMEVSGAALRRVLSVRPLAAAVLGVAPGAGPAELADAGRAYTGTEVACVYDVADPATERLVEEADVQEGCRAIGCTLGAPAPSMLGVVDDLLVDRAFLAERQHSAVELASVHDVLPFSPRRVADALAAAALARAYGVPPAAVRDGLRACQEDRRS